MVRRVARRVLPARARRLLRERRLGDRLERFRWTPADVADATGPAYNVRCYLERRGARELLAEHLPGRLAVGVDVGCGYGRLTMVLGEFCESVVGLEREASLLEIARPLLPEIAFVETPALRELPLEDASADLMMTFTVLQHLTDDDARGVLAEVKRVLRPGGYVLLMEKTDPQSVYGDPHDGSQLLSTGRPVETFASWLAPCMLVVERAGRVEPTYPGFDRVGTYMLFRTPEAAR